MKRWLLLTNVTALFCTVPLWGADEGTSTYVSAARTVLSAPSAETPDDLSNAFNRIAQALGDIPACGVDPEVYQAVQAVRGLAPRFVQVMHKAAAYERNYGDPKRIFLTALAHEVAGDLGGYVTERRLAEAELREEIGTLRLHWRDVRRLLNEYGIFPTTLTRRCEDVLARATTVLRVPLEGRTALGLAWALGSANDHTRLLEDCRRQLQVEPNDALAYQLRAAVHAALGRPQEALADCNDALRCDPQLGFALGLRARLNASASSNMPAAEADCAAALAMGPYGSFALCAQAAVHAHHQRFNDALVVATQALARNPLDMIAFATRGQARGSLGRYEEAVADCTAAIRLHSGLVWVYLNRARAFAALGQLEEALEDVNRAIRLDEEEIRSYSLRAQIRMALGHQEMALADLNHALKIAPNDLAALEQRAIVHQNLGDYARAAADLDAALAQAPTKALLHALRGDVRRCLRDLDRARADFDRAIQLEPMNPRFYMGRALVHAEQLRHEAALSDCDSAQRLGDNRPQLFVVRGYARHLQGDHEGALRECDQALLRDPHCPNADGIRRAATSARLQKNAIPGLPPLPKDGPSPALRLANLVDAPISNNTPLLKNATNQQARELLGLGGSELSDPPVETADACYDRGREHFKAGRFNDAVIEFSKVLRRDPNDTFAALKRGMAYAALKEDQEAEADFTRVIERDPRPGKARVYRATVRMRLKNFAGAVADCDDAIRREADVAEATMLRGHARDELGQYAAARDDYAHLAEKLEPTNGMAHNNLAWLLCTCPDDTIRDGKRALAVAQKACELTAWNEANVLDTYAAAYAECGYFIDAAKWQRRAVELAPEKQKEEMRTRIALYESKKPYRKPRPQP